MVLKNIVFDFDGTLVDSLQDVLDSLKIAFEQCGIVVQSYAPEKIMQFQLKDAIAAIAPKITVEQRDRVIGRFREIYDSGDYPNTTLMPTVADLLPKLKKRSIGMFIVSNKRQLPSFRILDKLSVRHFFTGIFNPDMYAGKKWVTKGELIAHAIKTHSISKNSAVYVGDSEGDVKAAKENGVRAIVVSNGYGAVSTFKIRPDFIIRQISEILTV
jgi:phosphoglycolate phosphatase